MSWRSGACFLDGLRTSESLFVCLLGCVRGLIERRMKAERKKRRRRNSHSKERRTRSKGGRGQERRKEKELKDTEGW